jgi:hypothetical protein
MQTLYQVAEGKARAIDEGGITASQSSLPSVERNSEEEEYQ